MTFTLAAAFFLAPGRRRCRCPQNLIPFPNRADIEHPPLDLPDQRALVGAIEPAEDCLSATGLTGLLEAPAPGRGAPAARRPLVVGWDNLNTHVSGTMADLIATRDWLAVFGL